MDWYDIFSDEVDGFHQQVYGLLNIYDSISAINKTLNKDLRELSFWLNASKIALNVAKTEIILFKISNKKLWCRSQNEALQKKNSCIPVC